MNEAAAPLTFNDLLRLSGIDERQVVVFRHRPAEPELNRVFDWLVAERSDLFDSYQSTHGPRTEAALRQAHYVASFIRHPDKRALFVGLYEIASHQALSVEEQLARSLHIELMSLGLTGTKAVEGRDAILEFDLRRCGWHDEWKGRLVIDWPGLERSWYRWANRNVFPVRAITDDSLLTPSMPSWDELALDWRELALLPALWRAKLGEWRGVYLIIDQTDGRQYVGSAYGQDNILQRWRDYARTGHGGNKLLRERDPSTFRFSILQRVSPDMANADIIAIEQSWKRRLRTLAPYGLNDN